MTTKINYLTKLTLFPTSQPLTSFFHHKFFRNHDTICLQKKINTRMLYNALLLDPYLRNDWWMNRSFSSFQPVTTPGRHWRSVGLNPVSGVHAWIGVSWLSFWVNWIEGINVVRDGIGSWGFLLDNKLFLLYGERFF